MNVFLGKSRSVYRQSASLFFHQNARLQRQGGGGGPDVSYIEVIIGFPGGSVLALQGSGRAALKVDFVRNWEVPSLVCVMRSVYHSIENFPTVPFIN